MIQEKIKSRNELELFCKEWKNEGLKIGFTSGSFDLIHAGHVEYLETAKNYCDILIVGLNSDNSVNRYKGKNRPIIPQQERTTILAGLESVDYVFIFEERRNHTNIEKLQPNFWHFTSIRTKVQKNLA